MSEADVETTVQLSMQQTDPAALRGAVEAVVLVVDEPVAAEALARAVDAPVEQVRATLGELAAEYTASGRGFDLREVGGGWRLYTREEFADVVEQFVLDGQQTRLTRAALETLAVVAYRQPVARARVAAIRGVGVDSVMRTLLGRGLVTENGTDAETGAVLYGTTALFLERLGIASLDELPSLAPLLPDIDGLDGEGFDLAALDPDGPDHLDDPRSGNSVADIDEATPSDADVSPST